MHKEDKERLGVILALISMVPIFIFSVDSKDPIDPQDVALNYTPTEYSIQVPLAAARTPEDRVPNTITYRTAKRLQKRLLKRTAMAPSIHTLAVAVKERRALMKQKASVVFSAPNEEDNVSWDVSLHRYPLWIKPQFTARSGHFKISGKRIKEYLEEKPIEGIEYPEDTIISEVTESGGRLIARSEGVAKEGYIYNVKRTVDSVYRALRSGCGAIAIDLRIEPGKVINKSGKKLGELTLLASGKSNFAGSITNRIKNIKKGLGEHLNNSVVAPGENFSFNNAISPPINTDKGWFMAYIILNGDELKLAPGGGICQVSTTLYRALVNAGLPVTERRAHSMFVKYYEKHGVGIDATIFPGQQDLVFNNDTEDHLLIQAYIEGDEATVNIYGTPDGRYVSLKGPFFAHNAPNDFRYKERRLWHNEIVWLQNVEYPNGKQADNIIYSRYKEMPKDLAYKFSGGDSTISSTESLSYIAP